MAYPTAMHRLRKSLLFHLSQQLELDSCFVCSEPIATAEELSIEHKIPWLDNGVDLFWDLENIAFSHRTCNKVHRPSTTGNGKSFHPEGLAWCTGHQELLPVEKFSIRSGKQHQAGKPRAYCKVCRNERMKQGLPC